TIHDSIPSFVVQTLQTSATGAFTIASVTSGSANITKRTARIISVSPTAPCGTVANQAPDIVLQLVDRLIERFETMIGAGEHHRSLHCRQYMCRERCRINIRRQTIARV